MVSNTKLGGFFAARAAANSDEKNKSGLIADVGNESGTSLQDKLNSQLIEVDGDSDDLDEYQDSSEQEDQVASEMENYEITQF